ncbi:MAG: PEGA domain-containing protein [Thermoanaerobaculales bacterium]
MRRLHTLCLFLLMGLPAMTLAGDVQVLSEPGLRVYLDNKFVGTSSAKDDGLFLADVPSGSHVIRVEKDGFLPQSFQVKVERLPVEVKVGPFSAAAATPGPQHASRPEVAEPPGNLVVISAPQNCSVEIDGTPHLKTIPVLRIEGLAAGEHTISFSRPEYNPVSRVVWVDSGGEVTVRGDLMAGKVEMMHEGKGSLQVLSVPNHCTVRFMGKTFDKTDLKLNVTYVPAGQHRITASWAGRQMSGDIVIIGGQRTVVTISFSKGAEPFAISYEPE